jgi:hypothetical protein
MRSQLANLLEKTIGSALHRIVLALFLALMALSLVQVDGAYASHAGDHLVSRASTDLCGLQVSIIAAPFAVVDSNKPGQEGPQAAMLAARITNHSGRDLSGVQVHIGDGVVPGHFPVSAGSALSLLKLDDATRLLVVLHAGESITSYWPVTYPPTFNVSYGYTIWVTEPGGCTASQTSQITTQSQISASSNKLLPTGSFMLMTPQTITPGEQISVQITGFTLGTIGQGPRPLSPYDAWLQPVGNLDFDPTCLRLVRSEVTLHSISATPFVDQLYFSGIGHYSSNAADTVRYTFLALRECTTVIQPYQEAASGTQEKYNSDYSAAASRIAITSSGATQLVLGLEADTTIENGEQIVQLSGSVYSSAGLIGYPDNGSPAVISVDIPEGTAYMPNSASISAPSILQYSTDGGISWTDSYPDNGEMITHLRWILEEPVDSSTVFINYDVVVIDENDSSSFVFSLDVSLLGAEVLASTSTAHVEQPTEPTPTPESDSVQSGNDGGLESSPIDFDPEDLIGAIGGDGPQARAGSGSNQEAHKARLLARMSLRLDDLMPQQGPAGTTPQPAMPVDVLAITSAPDAKAVDFVNGAGQVKAVALGVLSVGAPYEHDYGVCNRFKDFSVEDVQPVEINGRWFWYGRTAHPSGIREDALLFHIFVDESNKHLHVDSRWVRDGYPAQLPFAFDYVFNMQVWSNSLETSTALLTAILARLGQVDSGTWQVKFHNNGQPVAPQVYIKQSEVHADMLRITVVNVTGAAQNVSLYGAWRSYLNRDAATPIALNLTLPAGETRLSLPLPALLDVTLYAQSGGFVDKIYAGSGLWFALRNGETSSGQLTPGQCLPLDGIDPRDLFLAGCVSFTAEDAAGAGQAGFGRTLNPNGRPVDIGPYLALRFWARGDGSPVRIGLATTSVTDGDIYQLVFTPDNQWRQYTLPLADFRQQGFGQPVPWTARDVTAISWTNATASQNSFSLEIDGVSFTNASVITMRSQPADGADQGPRQVIVDTAPGTSLSSATLFYSLDEGRNFIAAPMQADAGGFVGHLPGLPLGSDVPYYIEALDANGYASRAPVDAPASFFRYRVESRPGLLIDDFSGMRLLNRFDGVSGLFHNQEAGGALKVYRRAGTLRLDYDVSDAKQFAGYYTELKGIDLSAYGSVSLRLRGASGGEQLFIGLRDSAGRELKVNVGAHLSGGITQDWRWVQIPLSAFSSTLDRTNLHSLSFTFAHGTGPTSGQLYVDEIRISSGPSLLVVDSFDGGNPQANARGGGSWVNAPGGSIAATTEVGSTANQGDFSPAGKALRLDYDVSPGGYALWYTDLRGAAATGALSFWVRGSGSLTPNLYLSDGAARVRLSLGDFVQLKEEWQFVSIPLNRFAAQGLSLANLTAFEVVFEFAAGEGVLWLDNITLGTQAELVADPRALHMQDVAERTVALRNSSGSRWQATSDQPWLLAPASGYGSSTLAIRTVNWGLDVGNHQGTITFTDDSGASETLTVYLTVTEPGAPLQRLFLPTVSR